VKPLARKRASFYHAKGANVLIAKGAEKKSAEVAEKKVRDVITAEILSRKGFILVALKGRNIPARR
jgi:hypothetical protein